MTLYHQVTYYTGGDDYETKSFIIDAVALRELQNQIADGVDFITLSNGKTIKRSLIAGIDSADDDIREYISRGMTHAQLGLKAPEEIAKKMFGTGDINVLQGGWKKIGNENTTRD
jgi:hypothetical protein